MTTRSQGKKRGTNNQGGRPSKYRPAFNNQAYKLCLLSSTDKDLADFFEVKESTLNLWKKEFPKFMESLKKGKLQADANVASRLYQRALGYKYDEVTFEKVDNKVNLEMMTTGEIKTNDSYKKKVVIKELAPDVIAGIFWLKNRQKDNWRDKHDLTIDYEKLTNEQLDYIIEKLQKNQKAT